MFLCYIFLQSSKLEFHTYISWNQFPLNLKTKGIDILFRCDDFKGY